MENKNGASEVFDYTYSAKRHDEVRRIRQKYIPTAEDKMAQLRRLDRGATEKATVVSLIVGIAGALVMGTGMSLVMVFEGYFALGVVVGVVGLAGVGLALPVYNRMAKKQREKIAPEIKRLSDELLNE